MASQATDKAAAAGSESPFRLPRQILSVLRAIPYRSYDPLLMLDIPNQAHPLQARRQDRLETVDVPWQSRN